MVGKKKDPILMDLQNQEKAKVRESKGKSKRKDPIDKEVIPPEVCNI